MRHEWKRDLNSNLREKMTIEVFNIAYMDDTTWISDSKNNIEKQLEIADSFNRFNGIKVNPEKSKLIIINNSEAEEDRCVKYGKNSTIIKPESDDSSVRFLGV